MTAPRSQRSEGVGVLSERQRELVARLLRNKGIQSAVLKPIPRRGGAGAPAPLSFAQQRLWFLHRLDPASPAYNMPMALRIEGRLDLTALSATLRELLRRHEVLRTSFPVIEGRPRQQVAREAEPEVLLEDLSAHPEAQREPEARRRAADEALRPFDLARGPLLRVRVLRLGPEEHVLLLTIHHIVSDGWSLGVLVREVAAHYGACVQGAASPLPELPLQYADFAVWQREWLSGENLERQLSYWRKQLAGAPAVLSLPTDRPRRSAHGWRGGHEPFSVAPAVTAGLRELGSTQGATLFMVLLAAFKALLARFGGDREIVVGTPIANRNRVELEPLIGFFVNNLVLRTDLSDDPPAGQLVARVRDVCLEAYAHQDLPFEKLVEELQPERDLGHHPLYQATFTLQNAPLEALELPGLRLTLFQGNGEGATSKVDLSLSLVEVGEGLAGSFEYSAGLFDPDTLRSLVRTWLRLIEGLARSPELRVSRLPLTGSEEREALEQWNHGGAAPRPPGCVHELFRERVQRAPEAAAVEWDGGSLTYGELDRRSNGIAVRLAASGVGPEVRVGLCMERSPDALAGLLGVLKAGGAYVPVDPESPPERLKSVLAGAGVVLVLTQERLRARLAATAPLLTLDGDLADVSAAEAPEWRGHTDNLAYVIFTSGSTGHPKGVLISHAALANYVAWAAEVYAAGVSGAVPLHTSLAFDLSVTSLFPPLVAGGRVVLVHEDGYGAEGLAAWLARGGRGGLLKLTPTHVEILNRRVPPTVSAGAAVMVVGGEQLHGETLASWRRHAPATRVFNEYGPTETTVGCCVYEVPAGLPPTGPVPIGRPIAGLRLYVLDAHLVPVPPGAVGELFIGGVGVARGYLDRPGPTAEAFLPDPFTRQPGARMYRSGDLARMRSDGELQCLGRADDQIKLRGFRIERGEIEAALERLPGVQMAAVELREVQPGDKRLVGYVVPRPGETPDPGELRRQLRHTLPEYMVPALLAVSDDLPLAASGKLDRRRLPMPAPGLDGRQAGPPRDALELHLVRLWERLLGVRPVGVADSFFDLGGHSLLASEMVAEIQERYSIELPLADLFRTPTVEALAAILREGAAVRAWSALVPLPAAGPAAPLFCVHAVGGNALGYLDLARVLDGARPVHALHAAGLDGTRAPVRNLEEMVSLYVGAVCGVRPQGPYLLAGWSFGAVIAFEMARRLEAGGAEVQLALIDGGPFASRVHDRLPAFVRELSAVHGIDLDLGEAATGASDDEALRLLFERARSAGIVVPSRSARAFRRMFDVYCANLEALKDYVPRSGPARALLVRPDDAPPLSVYDPESAWRGLMGAGLEVVHVPGDHYRLLKPPYVGEVAVALAAYFNGAACGS